MVMPLLGLGVAYGIYGPGRRRAIEGTGRTFDWGFDWLYDRILVRPFIFLSDYLRGDFIDSIYNGIASLNESLSRRLSATQDGKVRWYAGVITGGVVLLFAMALAVTS